MDELRILNTVLTALLAMLGASAGSFINVAALRRSAGLSFITGRSHCPSCRRTLSWFELIPVLSWFLLLGRCRKCKARISPRYMLVELMGAIAAGLCFVRYWLSWSMLLSFGVAVILLAITMFDISTMEIPNGLIIALIPFAAAAFWVQPDVALLERGIGFISVSVPMLILALLIDSAFGFGDVKLMAVCGFLLGWQNTVLAFFISVVTAGCLSIALILRGKAKKGAKIAFGPHLCLGVMAALLYGKEIISWYLSLFGF